MSDHCMTCLGAPCPGFGALRSELAQAKAELAKAESKARFALKMVNPEKLERGLAGIARALGSPEAEEIRHWSARAEQAESALAASRELLTEFVEGGPYMDDGGDCGFCQEPCFEEDAERSIKDHGTKCLWRKADSWLTPNPAKEDGNNG